MKTKRIRFRATLLALSALALPLSASDVTVDNLTVATGNTGDVVSADGITTTPRANPATDPFKVVIQPGGDSIFWARTRIALEDGFHATGGTLTYTVNGQQVTIPTRFWAAVDSNLNGYSDMEELQQHYISGVPDEWLLDHGVDLNAPMNTWTYSAAQYLAAYQGGYDPSLTNAGGTSSYGLVLRTPTGQFYGVTTSNWAITGL